MSIYTYKCIYIYKYISIRIGFRLALQHEIWTSMCLSDYLDIRSHLESQVAQNEKPLYLRLKSPMIDLK